MVNIDSLPKCIEFDGEWYGLNLHVTAFNKLCISYQNMAGPKSALEKNKEYNILSQVVEPNMNYPINYPKINLITSIVDAPNYTLAFNILSSRLNSAISNGDIKVIYK